MKDIIIKGDNLQYELVSIGKTGLVSGEYTHLRYKTVFYQGEEFIEVKGFFSKKKYKHILKKAFEMDINIEDWNFSKEEIKPKIERAYEIFKGEII